MKQLYSTPEDSIDSDSVAFRTLSNRALKKRDFKGSQQGGVNSQSRMTKGLTPNRNSFFNGQIELLNTGRTINILKVESQNSLLEQTNSSQTSELDLPNGKTLQIRECEDKESEEEFPETPS